MPFRLEPRGYLDPDVQAMIAEVQQEYVVLYGGPDAAEVDPDEFAPPRGLLLLGLLDGEPVASGGWRSIGTDGSVAEIKRMYVRPPFRRRGLAALVLAGLEDTARAAGVTTMALNTGPRQPEAVALYVGAGYAPTAAFGHYADVPTALFYGRALT